MASMVNLIRIFSIYEIFPYFTEINFHVQQSLLHYAQFNINKCWNLWKLVHVKFHLLQVSYLRTSRCTITRCILILEEQSSSSQSNEIKDPSKQTIENSRETPAQNKTDERINELNSQISAFVKLRDTGLAVVDKDKITKLKKELK